MKVSEFSVKHPVVITIILIVLVVFGFYSVSLMPTEFMADITMPQAIVMTVYPGASAEDVEQDVTKILEENFVFDGQKVRLFDEALKEHNLE